MTKSPSIKVSEISRLLINLRKRIQRSDSKKFLKLTYVELAIFNFAISEVRRALQLRSRSRKGIR